MYYGEEFLQMINWKTYWGNLVGKPIRKTYWENLLGKLIGKIFWNNIMLLPCDFH